MRFEAEVVVDELLPAMRSIVASKLQQEYGLKQEQIADKLGVTQPAVSQYLSGTRADQELVEKLKQDAQIEILLNDATSKAAVNDDFSHEFAKTVATVRDKGMMKERFSDTFKLIR
ncbi:MAG: transcriptional regulator [Candidatus Nanohaloarchaea archaeon]